MNYKFEEVSDIKTLSKLEKVREWLEKFQIETNNTRFDEIYKLNKELAYFKSEHRLNDLITKHENFKLWYAKTETVAYLDIYNALKYFKSHQLPKAKLRKMLRGPFLPWDESQNKSNNESRNILFELETAALFKKAGYEIIGFDDVDFHYNNYIFNVQCKRLFSNQNIKYNILEASNQLSKKIKSKNHKGIIALSIDKITGTEGTFIKADSPRSIEISCNSTIKDFIEKYKIVWKKIVNPNILGVLVVFHIIALINRKPHDLITACKELGFYIIPSNNIVEISNYNLIQEISLNLKKLFT